MKDCKAKILGTTYKIRFRHENEDEKLQELSGYCDYSNKTIVVAILEKSVDSVDNIESVQKSVLRQEIMHAFLYESGLDGQSCNTDCWANNEEMIDWFALQSKKIFKVFKRAGAL